MAASEEQEAGYVGVFAENTKQEKPMDSNIKRLLLITKNQHPRVNEDLEYISMYRKDAGVWAY